MSEKTSQYRGLLPSMLYSNEKLATLKLQRANASLPKLNREEIKVITKQYNDDFKLESVETRTKYESLSDGQPDLNTVDKDCENLRAYAARRRFNLCSSAEALLQDRVAEVFSANASAENVGGLARTAAKLRQYFATSTVMHDKGELELHRLRRDNRPHEPWNMCSTQPMKRTMTGQQRYPQNLPAMPLAKPSRLFLAPEVLQC